MMKFMTGELKTTVIFSIFFGLKNDTWKRGTDKQLGLCFFPKTSQKPVQEKRDNDTQQRLFLSFPAS